MQKYFVWLAAALLAVACTKDGDTIYLPDPNEEQASSAPLVTVIYGDNSLGDRSYCDMIYEGVERTAQGLAWRNGDVGRGMTADLLRQTISQMQQQGIFRKMLVLTEPCFSEAVITPLVGITGVLAMSSAGRYEQSFADNWSSTLGVWRCDRFSHNIITHLSANPSTTYRDLFLYCAQHTLGSHVRIVNSANFDNLYTTGPLEFFEKR